jgi:hypothetical protein
MLQPSTKEDSELIYQWTALDRYHRERNNPTWWLTGNGGLLSFVWTDEEGKVFFCRLDPNEKLLRISVQFAPEEVVSKRRLIRAMLKCWPILVQFAKSEKYEGMVFTSVSPLLVKFMSKLNFKEAEDSDYVFKFEAQS